MKKEQIIEILETWDDYVLGGDINDDIADAILALPLDVPSDEETEEILWEEISIPLSEQDRLNNTAAYKQYKETFLWMRWMRDEIIKRNK
jgi:hypothetical protein